MNPNSSKRENPKVIYAKEDKSTNDCLDIFETVFQLCASPGNNFSLFSTASSTNPPLTRRQPFKVMYTHANVNVNVRPHKDTEEPSPHNPSTGRRFSVDVDLKVWMGVSVSMDPATSDTL